VATVPGPLPRRLPPSHCSRQARCRAHRVRAAPEPGPPLPAVDNAPSRAWRIRASPPAPLARPATFPSPSTAPHLSSAQSWHRRRKPRGHLRRLPPPCCPSSSPPSTTSACVDESTRGPHLRRVCSAPVPDLHRRPSSPPPAPALPRARSNGYKHSEHPPYLLCSSVRRLARRCAIATSSCSGRHGSAPPGHRRHLSVRPVAPSGSPRPASSNAPKIPLYFSPKWFPRTSPELASTFAVIGPSPAVHRPPHLPQANRGTPAVRTAPAAGRMEPCGSIPRLAGA
jgi:hypothetical protein